jgi:hypothetical protein
MGFGQVLGLNGVQAGAGASTARLGEPDVLDRGNWMCWTGATGCVGPGQLDVLVRGNRLCWTGRPLTQCGDPSLEAVKQVSASVSDK